MAAITPEQRRAIEDAGRGPIALEDPETKAADVLMTAEDFERVQSSLASPPGPDDLRAFSPLMDQVASAEGWDEPAMDIYNDDEPIGPPAH